MMIRIYIVDDEPLSRDELKYLLKRSKDTDIVGESDNLETAIEDIASLKPDLLFLDIELAGENGLDLAKRLIHLPYCPAIVFATAYDQYAIDAFNLDAIDYILKPFEEERVFKTLEKAKKRKPAAPESQDSGESVPAAAFSEKLPVLVDDRIVILSYSEILNFESCEGKCVIRTVEREYKVNGTLVLFEKKLLNSRQFIRVHRGVIVNVNHIAEVEPWFNSTYNLIMSNGSKIPVSRTYVKDFKHLIGI